MQNVMIRCNNSMKWMWLIGSAQKQHSELLCRALSIIWVLRKDKRIAIRLCFRVALIEDLWNMYTAYINMNYTQYAASFNAAYELNLFLLYSKYITVTIITKHTEYIHIYPCTKVYDARSLRKAFSYLLHLICFQIYFILFLVWFCFDSNRNICFRADSINHIHFIHRICV